MKVVQSIRGVVLSALLFTYGCRSAMYPLTGPGMAELNDRAGDEGGTIVLRITGEEIEAERLQFRQDTLYWKDVSEEMPGFLVERPPIPAGLISELNFTSHLTGLLVWAGIGMIPVIIAGNSDPEDREAKYGYVLIASLVPVTLGIIGYVNGINHHYIITDPQEWSDLMLTEQLAETGRIDKALDILDRTISTSDDTSLITTALFLKMKYELADPVSVYETLKAEFPGHIYTLLAERLLRDKYGIRPVR